MADAVLTSAHVPVQERRVPADAGALLAAAEADATALADRLHDGALQALVVARYATDAVARGADPGVARAAVQDALVALRRAVWLLRPRGDADLATALADLSAQLVAAGLPPLALDLDPLACTALSPVARGLAYRFVQAVAADGAHVRLRAASSYAELSVTGDVPDVPGWTARAAALGGRLDPAAPPRLLLPLPDCDPEGDR